MDYISSLLFPSLFHFQCSRWGTPKTPRQSATDDGEVVSLTRCSPFTPRKIPGTHFYYRLSRPQGHIAAGRIRSIEKSNGPIGNRTRDLPSCSIVPQPTTLPRVLKHCNIQNYNCTCSFVWVWNLALTWREEYWLKVFEKRMVERLFGTEEGGVNNRSLGEIL
jgi:hypothetical protein